MFYRKEHVLYQISAISMIVLYRRTLEDLKREYEEDLERLKKAKDQQIEAAITSHETTKCVPYCFNNLSLVSSDSYKYSHT